MLIQTVGIAHQRDILETIGRIGPTIPDRREAGKIEYVYISSSSSGHISPLTRSLEFEVRMPATMSMNQALIIMQGIMVVPEELSILGLFMAILLVFKNYQRPEHLSGVLFLKSLHSACRTEFPKSVISHGPPKRNSPPALFYVRQSLTCEIIVLTTTTEAL